MITVLETADQVRWFAQNTSGGPNQANVLAVTPNAAYACQVLSQPYLKLEDFARISRRAIEYNVVLGDYLKWEAQLDCWVHQVIPEFGAAGFKPASAASFPLQVLFAEIWATVSNLREFLKATQPDSVAVWPPVIDKVPWFLHPLTSAASTLLPDVARAQGIKVIDLSASAPQLTPVSKATASHPSHLKQVEQWGRRRLRRLINEVVDLRASGLRVYSKQFAPGAPLILVSGQGYDIAPLSIALRRQGCRLTVLDEPPPQMAFGHTRLRSRNLTARLRSGWAQLVESPDFWRLMAQWELGHTPLWERPFHFWWHHMVPELWSRYRHVEDLLARHKYAAFVNWDAGSGLSYSAAWSAATSAQVPCYSYQHGSTCGVDAKGWQIYLRLNDIFFVYGQATAQELVETCPPYLDSRAKIVPVGSSRLDMLRRQRTPEQIGALRAQLQAGDPRPIVLYVPTCFAGYGGAVSDLSAYPDVSYLELQQAVLRLWAETPGVRLLYKDFAVESDANLGIVADFVEKHVPGAQVTRQRLTDLMWAVDAIVVDHAITALGEVLLTNKRLVVYVPQPNVGPQAKALLRKRAMVAETPDEFITQVRALLQAGEYPEVSDPNTEFLQAYGTHLDDGQSAERAATVILQGLKLRGSARPDRIR